MSFTYITGGDDFLVTREGKRVFAELTKDVADEYSKEIIDGTANKVEEVERAVANFRSAVQTISMFGDKKVVWFKDVSFLQDNQTGKAEGTLAQLEILQNTLETLDPAAVSVVITATGADRRKSFAKWLEKAAATFTKAGGSAEEGHQMLATMIKQECEALNVSMSGYAQQVLVSKVSGNTRLILEELRKLATYVGEGGTIEVHHVSELVPSLEEGNFFEASNAFAKGDLKEALDAIRKYFFIMKDARPMLTTLQNNNRLLVQLQALADSGDIRAGGWLDAKTLQSLAGKYAQHFEVSVDEMAEMKGAKKKAKKAAASSFNLFSQSAGKLGYLCKDSVGKRSLRQLIDFQLELVETCMAIVERGNEQEQVMREMAIRNLR